MLVIGAIASTETPSADEQADALRVLNRMLTTWSNDSLMIASAATRETFSLISGQQVYTVGPTGTFVTSRPTDVQFISIGQPGSPAFETPVDLINAQQWSEILVKGTTSTFPTKAYVEFTNPNLTISVWPIPQLVYQIEITSLKPLVQFVSVNDTVSLPPGYEDAIVYNLAVRLTPMYSKQLDPVVNEIAIGAKEKIERQNISEILLDTDPALIRRSGAFNYLTGK